MAIYEVLRGQFERREKPGRDGIVRYNANGSGAGRYVHSDVDLCELFPNKFRKMPDVDSDNEQAEQSSDEDDWEDTDAA